MCSIVGGKARIGPYIAEKIYSVTKSLLGDDLSDTIYWEGMVGQCGVMRHTSEFGYRVGSDLNPDTIAMWQQLQTGEFIPPKKCSKKRYYQIKNMKSPSALRGMIGHAASFGGYFFGSYAGQVDPKTGRSRVLNGYNGLMRVLPLVQDVKFYHCSYDQLKIDDFCICYFDVPYSGTKQPYVETNFDTEKFWRYADNLSKENIVFVSEETAPDHYVPIWSLDVTRTVNAYNPKARTKTTENLFIHPRWLQKNAKQRVKRILAKHKEKHDQLQYVRKNVKTAKKKQKK